MKACIVYYNYSLIIVRIVQLHVYTCIHCIYMYSTCTIVYYNYSLIIIIIMLTDFTLCPMPIISLCCFLVSFTNSMGNIPESYACENWRAAPSRAPPNLSPFGGGGRRWKGEKKR